MKKNLKKVISSVVALALSLGSLSAFAASYTDVAETASYATAVNELSALGIVNGYEDGTFKPDAKVTRAEVTKMVVAALAQTAAADASKGATKFTDVASDHWAAGFVNVGSGQSGFINGMGDGTFAPEANVTYAQLVKMLVSVLGYGGMALQEGGYPTGYITVGDRIGVTKAVVANANDELTRGQVAVLIDNSVNLPLLVNTVWSASNPEYEIKDGKGSEFQTLLTQYHDTYKVEGKLVQTSKSDSALETDEARFEIAVADRFDDDDWFTRTEETRNREEIVKVADGIDATSALFSYSTALIHKNDDDEFELISLNSTAKSKTAELSAGAFDEDNTVYKSYNGDTEDGQDAASAKAAAGLVEYEVLKYYATDAKTGKVTEYKLANGDDTDNEAQLWVNGVKLNWNEANLYNYVTDNNVGTVTLVDAPQEGKATTDGYYDYVLVTYYKSAVVSDVMSDGTIYFDTMETGLESSMEFDQDKVEDGELTYSITLDGKEIDFKDLQEDDVIAIAYDVTEKFEDSSFYDVIVTRGTVEGKITSEDEEDETYTVGGTEYKFDKNKLQDGYKTDKVGSDAVLYVDAFGRIVKLDESSSSKKFAIIENVYQKAGEKDLTVKIILPDTTKVELTAKNTDAEADAQAAYDKDTTANKTAPWLRVVEYKSNSSDEIYGIKSVTGKLEDSEEYTAKSNKVGAVKLNDNTSILDASDYSGKISDYKKVSSLTDDTKYTVYGFDKLSDSTYSFVIVAAGIGDYTDDTQVAVFVKPFKDTDKDGDSRDAMEVLYEGKSQTYILDDVDTDNINKGDVIIFKTNSSDEVDDIKVIAKMNLCNGTKEIDPETRHNDGDYKVAIETANFPTAWKANDSDVGLKADGTSDNVYYGRITDKASGEITLVNANDDTTSDEEVTFDIDDETIVYVYSYKKANKEALFVGNSGNIVKTVVPSQAKDDDTDEIDWTFGNLWSSTNYAFVKAVDGDAKQVVVVIMDKE